MIDNNMTTSGKVYGKVKLAKGNKIIERSEADYLNNKSLWNAKGYEVYFEKKEVKKEVKEVKEVKKAVKKETKKDND